MIYITLYSVMLYASDDPFRAVVNALTPSNDYCISHYRNKLVEAINIKDRTKIFSLIVNKAKNKEWGESIFTVILRRDVIISRQVFCACDWPLHKKHDQKFHSSHQQLILSLKLVACRLIIRFLNSLIVH